MAKRVFLIDGPKAMLRDDLAHSLSKHLGVPIFTGSISTSPAQFVQAMQPALDDERPVVINNSWLMDRILFEVRGVRKISQVSHRALDRLALGCGAISFKACTSVRMYLTNLSSQKNYLTSIGIHQAFDIYNAWDMLSTVFETYIINMLTDSFKHVVVPEVETAIHSDPNPGPGIGAWKQGVILMVGDRQGNSRQPYTVKRNIAFVSMSGVGCSDWLNARLLIPEDKMYWINAYDRNGSPTPDVTTDLKPKAIIALGGAAEHWCEQHGLDYHRVPHPQYWKRFHVGEPYELIPLMGSLLK